MPSAEEIGPVPTPATIILVEDDSGTIEILTVSLAQDNVRVLAAHNSVEALALASSSGAELVLLDLGLPELDGFAILEQLKRNPATAQIPVIVLTAWHGTKEKLRGFDLGAVDYITKPFELVELRARVRSTLRTKRLQDQLTRANRALEEARAAAEEGGRAKAEFLANMSHEIRTPMNGVIAMTGILLQTELTHEQRDFVETIRTSGESLVTIINDILNFSKIQSGKLELEHCPVALDVCIEEALDLLAAKAGEKDLDLAYKVDEQAPRQVMSDVTRLRQVLVNLIGNAIKFTSTGHVQVEVRSTRMPQPPRCVAISNYEVDASGAPIEWWEMHFSVQDTGIGIPEDRVDRLFQSFSQVDSSTTRQFGGTGLGLAISKGLVELMGGRMWVESTLGKGTTFHFILPLPAAPAAKAANLLKGPPQLVGLRMLLIDHHVMSRMVVSEWAKRWNMTVHEVASAAEGLEWLPRNQGCDLIVVDARASEMEGRNFSSEVRKLPRCQTVPLVLMGAAGYRPEANAQNPVQYTAVIGKPIKPAQLRKTLLEVISGTKAVVKKVAPSSTMDATMAQRLPLRILLTDDNVINQKVASRLLQQLGYKADIANNGVEALKALERQPYDMIFMDVQMPEMDGLEATRQIRLRAQDANAHPHFKNPVIIIAMTANAMQGDREKCLAAGMNDYIPKPVRPELLQSAIERLAPRQATPEVPPTAPVSPVTSTANNSTPAPTQEIFSNPASRQITVAEEAVIDRDRLLEFAGGSFENLTELIDLYLNQTTEQLDQIRAAIQVGLPEKVARVAHSCAGASATCGMVGIVPHLRQLEQLGTTGNLSAAEEHLASVAQEFARIKHLLERFPEPLSSTDSKS